MYVFPVGALDVLDVQAVLPLGLADHPGVLGVRAHVASVLLIATYGRCERAFGSTAEAG